MNTPYFGPAYFTGIGYGILGDIIGRQYEATFFFLQHNKEDEWVRNHYLSLIQDMRSSFPFYTLKTAWKATTGSHELWEKLQHFLKENVASPFSDDTVLTIATIRALVWSTDPEIPFKHTYRNAGREYPNAGYGRGFRTWFANPIPQPPYGAKTNGSAMRVGPIGYLDIELEKILDLAKQSAEVTHNSHEGIVGAQIVANAIYLIRHDFTFREMSEQLLERHFPGESHDPEYMSIDKFNFDCLPSVRHCLAIMKSHRGNFDSLMRTIITYGGDTDTFGMICGSIFGATHPYKVLPSELHMRLREDLPSDFFSLLL